MEERKQFTFYLSIFKAIRKIKKKTDRADAYDAICAYALFGEEPDLEAMTDSVSIAFELIRPVLDASRRKSKSGKQGGSKPKQNERKPEAKDTPNFLELVHRCSDRTRRVLPKEVSVCRTES